MIRRAKLFERLFPWIHDGATLVNEDLINPPGVSDSQRQTEDLREMARSQDVAAAVALKYLGYKVQLTPIGALISQVYADSPAAKAGLEPTEVIVSADGQPVRKIVRSASADLEARARPDRAAGGFARAKGCAPSTSARSEARTAGRWSASWSSRRRT